MKKKHKLLRSLSLADDKYVREADPSVKVNSHRKLKIALSVAACFMIAINLWLFIPIYDTVPDMSEYSDSEYYSIILKINELTYRKPEYKNNYERYLKGSRFKNAMEDGAEVTESFSIMSGVVDGSSYVEVTDNQVANVIEGDRIKRSDKYIFYLREASLDVYSIEGEQSREVGYYKINYAYDYEKCDMYLSEDATTVTIFTRYYENGKKGNEISILFLDVSDVENIKEKNRVLVTGNYLSSRLTDGDFLMFSTFNVAFEPNFSDEKTFIPQIDTGDGYESIPVEDIISPDKLNTAKYTVVCRFDGENVELIDSSAFLSYTTDIYVSEDNLYVAREFSAEEDFGDNTTLKTDTSEISAMCYSASGFEHLGTVTVDGHIKDQYSMDEYDGLLRVTTTTRTDTVTQLNKNGATSTKRGDTNANLYCIDFDSDSIVASVIAFAPDGEVVRSARFDGTNAYICTSVQAVQLTDPVFFFDLSDLENITVKDTGTIEGYSSSLINFAEGYLMGIGYGSTVSDLKIEIYTEGEGSVESVCQYVYEDTSFSENYKSYYVDRANGLIGIGITCGGESYQNEGDSSRYVVLEFDGERLVEILNVAIEGRNGLKRGVYIDGYMYVFGGYNDFVVKKLDSVN